MCSVVYDILTFYVYMEKLHKRFFWAHCIMIGKCHNITVLYICRADEYIYIYILYESQCVVCASTMMKFFFHLNMLMDCIIVFLAIGIYTGAHWNWKNFTLTILSAFEFCTLNISCSALLTKIFRILLLKDTVFFVLESLAFNASSSANSTV